MTTLTAELYRKPLFDPNDSLFRRCLTTTSALGAVMVLAMLIAPVRNHVINRVEQLPPRFAKLILEPPKQMSTLPVPKPLPAGDQLRHGAAVDAGGGGGGGGGPSPVPVEHPGPIAVRALENGGHIAVRALGPGNGTAGRARAQAEVGAALVSSTSSIASSLDGLSSSLQRSTALDASGPTASVAGPGGRGRLRGVRAARSDGQLNGGAGGIAGGGSSADLGNSVVVGSLVSIGGGSGGGWGPGSGGGSGGGIGGGTGTGFGTGTGPGSGSGSGGGMGSGTGTGIGSGSGPGRGAAPGVYRSNASLLAVIQRYSAGIQYCYGNELKRDPSLRGKLVVALTVSAAGDVVEATVVQNSVGSSRLAECALSQMRDWKFPPIAEGLTAFQAPFVFTPPS